jgi:drug/metabolite transporter (DMT)-like permease
MFLIFTSILFHVFASVFIKYGALSMDNFTLYDIITNYHYFIALFFLFLQALSWQLVLKKYKLSTAYMFNSLYYPLILLISFFIFKEDISWGNILGTAIIIFGLMIGTKKEQNA